LEGQTHLLVPDKIDEPAQLHLPYFPIYPDGQDDFIQYLLSILKNCKFPNVDGQSLTQLS
jgi:hypothetical protein